MVTYNRDDFLAATHDAFASSGPHAGLLILTHRLPRDPVSDCPCARALGGGAKEAGAWPMQDYEVDFLSH
jgi:hypothetical protein